MSRDYKPLKYVKHLTDDMRETWYSWTDLDTMIANRTESDNSFEVITEGKKYTITITEESWPL